MPDLWLTGGVIEAYAVPDVYAAEEDLMATLPDGALMARAVRGLAAVARVRLQERGGRRVVALVGPGNNGADALFAAARLARKGYQVAALHRPQAVHEGAREAAVEAGVDLSQDCAVLADADLVLDGIVGIGGRAGLPEFAADWVAAVPPTAYVIAVDLPSGQDPAGGALDPGGVFADETVTFSVAKPVHLLPPTEAACGLLTVVDIGLDLDAMPAVRRLDHDDVARLWPIPSASDDKYSRGVLGVIAGSQRYPGAAVLAVTAAVEAGAGMVRYLGPDDPTRLVLASVPEAVPGPGRVAAWAIGPGLDSNPGDRDQLYAAHAALLSDRAVLLDAGGLALLSPDLARQRAGMETLLTPHAGECAALLTRLGQPVSRAEVERSPHAAAAALAALTDATVLLKGSTTLIVGPESAHPAWSQADAPGWLATAGAGDVLAGLAGVLLAAGLPALHAGALAALVHGVAADEVSRGGPVRALRVAHAIPQVLARLLTRAT